MTKVAIAFGEVTARKPRGVGSRNGVLVHPEELIVVRWGVVPIEKYDSVSKVVEEIRWMERSLVDEVKVVLGNVMDVWDDFATGKGMDSKATLVLDRREARMINDDGVLRMTRAGSMIWNGWALGKQVGEELIEKLMGSGRFPGEKMSWEGGNK